MRFFCAHGASGPQLNLSVAGGGGSRVARLRSAAESGSSFGAYLSSVLDLLGAQISMAPMMNRK